MEQSDKRIQVGEMKVCLSLNSEYVNLFVFFFKRDLH